jgi:hypothetical protein
LNGFANDGQSDIVSAAVHYRGDTATELGQPATNNRVTVTIHHRAVDISHILTAAKENIRLNLLEYHEFGDLEITEYSLKK